MILSSADIIRVLGGDVIVRQEAKLSIVEGGPKYSAEDAVCIYVDKYPTIDEFEATWKIWVQDNSGMGKYVLDAMTSLLPNFDYKDGYYCTSDFATSQTVVKTEAEKQLEELASERVEYRKDFQGLSEHVEGVLRGVRDGRDGKDGVDGLQGLPGRNGKDGRDGRDVDATEAELFDLKDVEEGLALEVGHVLTWNGSKWTNLYTRQVYSAGGAAGGNSGGSGGDGASGTGGIEEAPLDGNYYVRSEGKWLNMVDVLDGLGYMRSDVLDGGDFTNVTTDATDDAVVDGGDFE